MLKIAPAAEFEQLVATYLDGSWQRDPVSATFVGVYTYDHTLGDHSDAAFEESKAYHLEWQARFADLSDAGLAPSQKLDLRFLQAELSTTQIFIADKEWQKAPGMYPEQVMYGVEGVLFRDIPLEERLQLICQRLEEAEVVLEHGKRNLRPEQISAEHVPSAIETANEGAAYLRDELPVLTTDSALQAYVRARSEPVATALEAYAHWLETAIAPHATGSFVIGEVALARYLKETHLLDHTPASMLALGYATFAQLQKELEEAAAVLGTAPWPEQVDALKQVHPSGDVLVASYRESMQEAKAFVKAKDLFDFPQHEELDVIATPAYERPFLPFAAYYGPPPFGHSRKGYFYVTEPDKNVSVEEQESTLTDHTTYGIPITAAHEAYPGHHLQMSLAADHKSAVRKSFSTNFFIEGWGLYSEQLMTELGFLSAPEVKLFQLKDLLWRAARIIIDVQLCTGQMSFEQAVDFLVTEIHFDRSNAHSEVLRYSCEPTQPMSYMVGRLQLLELRSKALAAGWTLREFHTRLLACGSIPLKLAELELGLAT